MAANNGQPPQQPPQQHGQQQGQRPPQMPIIDNADRQGADILRAAEAIFLRPQVPQNEDNNIMDMAQRWVAKCQDVARYTLVTESEAYSQTSAVLMALNNIRDNIVVNRELFHSLFVEGIQHAGDPGAYAIAYGAAVVTAYPRFEEGLKLVDDYTGAIQHLFNAIERNGRLFNKVCNKPLLLKTQIVTARTAKDFARLRRDGQFGYVTTQFLRAQTSYERLTARLTNITRIVAGRGIYPPLPKKGKRAGNISIPQNYPRRMWEGLTREYLTAVRGRIENDANMNIDRVLQGVVQVLGLGLHINPGMPNAVDYAAMLADPDPLQVLYNQAQGDADALQNNRMDVLNRALGIANAARVDRIVQDAAARAAREAQAAQAAVEQMDQGQQGQRPQQQQQ